MCQSWIENYHKLIGTYLSNRARPKVAERECEKERGSVLDRDKSKMQSQIQTVSHSSPYIIIHQVSSPRSRQIVAFLVSKPDLNYFPIKSRAR